MSSEGRTVQSHERKGAGHAGKVTIFWVWNVHAETIAVAIAEPDGEVRSLGTIPNRAESIRKLTNKLAQQRSCEPVMRPDRRATSCAGSFEVHLVESDVNWAISSQTAFPG